MTGDRRTPGSAADPLWYKDAIIYELHVKTFCDGNGDGVGDFEGLISKLDYLVDLGATCLWLLPFYESPRRDDGYDIAHYERIDPQYGTLSDFDRFLAEAHARRLQVITELVINHTSDQHPWFQAARRAPAGSPKRDFYVWSETPERYADAPIIFRDVEPSNWSWDPVAGAYYWHRFFHHQPDLNFDNPGVRRAVMKIMRFWLSRGVDGLRLDAVPYLFERDGTTCQNLPETHQFVKRIRADIDRRFENRVLLAEANHWPSDVRPYFGDGDECHMAFHFPLMPRLFMALKREDATLIADIVSQTRDLPPTCQWAVFLRNHDELTLSAVTDEERDFLYGAYAADPRMRLNHGIRRRLAPLLDNQRRRLDLAYALLLSLPGSPVIYYGDEIGMGDDIRLGDRNGVRTPMQWTSDPHGGFSSGRSEPVLPVIDDPMYSYLVLNVDAQSCAPASLLNHVKRLVRVRRRHRSLSRGSIEFLTSDNHRVLAFVRRWHEDAVLVVANLSSSTQSVRIGCPPDIASAGIIDLITSSRLRPISSDEYALTLDPHASSWLHIASLSPAGRPVEPSGTAREVTFSAEATNNPV